MILLMRRVSHAANVSVPSCAEDDEEDDEDSAVETVVDVAQSWSLHLESI